MVGLQREDAGEVRLELGQRLRRHAEHEVDRERAEAGGAGVGDGALGLAAAVAAAERRQVLGFERLHAEREARDAAGGEGVELRPRQVVGVGLDGDLERQRAAVAVEGRRKGGAHVGEHGGQAVGAPQAGGAAAEVDTAQASSVE